MPKYIVETISMFRIRYVVDAKEGEHADDTVTMNNGTLSEFSQYHVNENIISTREIDDAEYLLMFDKDNDYLKDWSDNQKLSFINIVDYTDHDKCGTPECCKKC